MTLRMVKIISISLLMIFKYLFVKHSVTETCECGKSLTPVRTSRIIGGTETIPHEFSWAAAVLYNERLYCGGTLINSRYVLTAGHCIKWTNPANLTVALGMHTQDPFDGIIVGVERVIIHDNFTTLLLYDENDIALIKLKEEIKFSKKIQPVCLPIPNVPLVTKKVVIGWGQYDKSKKITSNVLRKTNIKIVEFEDCRKTKMAPYLSDTTFCAYETNKDACQGDSGGALLSRRKSGETEITGIISWGFGCATPNIPGLYTKVEKYIPWIMKNTNDAQYCRNKGTNIN